MRRLYRVLLLFAFQVSSAVAACYFPNGDVIEADTPCNSSGPSTCCGEGFACVSNNLCMVTEHYDAGPGQSTYVRGSCTDKTWESDECPQFCLDWDHGDSDSGGVGVAKCPLVEERYYCLNRYADSMSPSELCLNETNFFTLAANPTTVTIIGVTSSTSLSSSASATSTSDASSTSQPPPSSTTLVAVSTTIPSTSSPTDTPAQQRSGNSNSLAIGAGVGVPLGVIAISVALFLFYRHRRHEKSLQPPPNQPIAYPYPVASGPSYVDSKPKTPVFGQLNWGCNYSNPQELPGYNFDRQELG
ncbi:hypothetical protein DDE83_007265 [Stemphylium lycopersici]|uniref:Mid2 domain-containing protein n=1 Tax=Stemphylium lycopersici TaxID=183478 RepID=A0A364MWG2_STELY|nr:hypothetical protein DDE83_007265 [Stemphylium lycopersici]